MAIDYKEKYEKLLTELIDFKELEQRTQGLENVINGIRGRHDIYEGEYKTLSRQRDIKKYWCQELLKTRFMLSTLIVMSCSLIGSFFGGLWISDLLKITSDSLSALIALGPAIIIGSVEYHFMYQKRVDNDKYLQEELQNNEEYQNILEQLRRKEGQIKASSFEYESISRQMESVSFEMDTKRAIISSMIDTLGTDEDPSVSQDTKSFNGLARKKVKNDEVVMQPE